MKSSIKNPKRINNYEVYPKAGVAQTIMYQNMSSHYRRIYNAKSRVDNKPPFSHRPIKPQPLRSLNWNKKQNDLHLPIQSQSSITLRSKCSRESCGEQPLPSFQPKMPKSAYAAESKLRTLRVYHPPRRRVYASVSDSSVRLKSDPETDVPEIPWIHSSDEEIIKTTPSKGSSSDSAYTEEGEGGWSGGESRGPTPLCDTRRALSSENLLYVKFVRGITDEVLRKGVFTNKALKKIFQNHIDSHKDFLNLRRMQEEVEKLQAELGIPKEDDLDSDYVVQSNESMEPRQKQKQDKELMDALSQLNISPSLKADIANSLGLYSGSSDSAKSTSLTSSSYGSIANNSSTNSLKLSHGSKHTTFSTPLEVIHDVKVPQSDDDSYELFSEGSNSRPPSPLGLAW